MESCHYVHKFELLFLSQFCFTEINFTCRYHEVFCELSHPPLNTYTISPLPRETERVKDDLKQFTPACFFCLCYMWQLE